MDETTEPSSQGVSSIEPVDHCWCQWPRHQRFIIAPQMILLLLRRKIKIGAEEQLLSQAGESLNKALSVFSPHINNGEEHYLCFTATQRHGDCQAKQLQRTA